MTASLGTYAPPVRIESDKIRVDSLYDTPLLIKAVKYIEDFTSTEYPTPKPVIIVDVVNLATGDIWIGPLWGAAAVVDGLKPYVGTDQVLAVMPYEKQGKSRKYASLRQLEGPQHAAAAAWLNAYPTALADRRAQKEAQAALVGAAPVAPLPVQGVPAPAPGVVLPPSVDVAAHIAAGWTMAQINTQYGTVAAPAAPVPPAPAPPVAAPPAPVAPVAASAPVAPPVPAAPVAPAAAMQQPSAEAIQWYLAQMAAQQTAQAAVAPPAPAAPNPSIPAPPAPVPPAPVSGQIGDPQIMAAIANLTPPQ